MEVWQEENWSSREAYEKHYCDLAYDLELQSKAELKEDKRRWMEADKRLELDKAMESFSRGNGPTRTKIHLVPQAVEKHISVLTDSRPRPALEARQPPQEQMVGALNYLMQRELDANHFDTLLHKVCLDMMRFHIGCLKVTISTDNKGPFGQAKSVKLSKVDPRCLWPDPYAASWRWDDMTFLVVPEVMDVTTIRNKFPLHGRRVEAEPQWSIGLDDEEASGSSSMDFPSKNGNGFTIGERHRAVVRELWLKDQTQIFEPLLDNDGNPKLDDEGEPLGEWIAKYPDGRLIITCNGVVLIDCPNPFAHGQPPYVFFQHRHSTKLFSFGDVELLARIEDKLDIIHKDMMRNARVNINSPWLIDDDAVASPELLKRGLTNEEGLTIIKQRGAEIRRLPPAELPQFLFPMLQWLGTMFNDLSGVSDIMQGNIQNGTQLSAQAIGNLQGASAKNIQIKKRLLEQAIEQLGYVMAWTVRQAYDSPMTLQIPDPTTGVKKEFVWDPLGKDSIDVFEFDVNVGSGLSGAKSSIAEQAFKMYELDLIDKEQFHSMLRTPNRDQFLKRMQERETELAKLGLEANVKKKNNKNGASGRKVKTFDI